MYWLFFPGKMQIALIAASGLAHELGLFLIAPTLDFRYSHYMIYAVMLALLRVVLLLKGRPMLLSKTA
jgi:hypothetical protein